MDKPKIVESLTNNNKKLQQNLKTNMLIPTRDFRILDFLTNKREYIFWGYMHYKICFLKIENSKNVAKFLF